MQKLTIPEACNKFHWHDSSARSVIYDEARHELTIELELCDCIVDGDENDNILFNGQKGNLIFHGISNFSIEPQQSTEKIDFEFLSSECLRDGELHGLLLWGISWLNIPTLEQDYFTLSFLADSATWHPKPITNNQSLKTNYQSP